MGIMLQMALCFVLVFTERNLLLLQQTANYSRISLALKTMELEKWIQGVIFNSIDDNPRSVVIVNTTDGMTLAESEKGYYNQRVGTLCGSSAQLG